jgi:predicted DNA-binding transcriptional regulator YafY
VLALSAAARDDQLVRIDHTRGDGAPTARVVDPYGLVIHARRWYLVGHDHLRDGIRTFRVDRISRATALSRRFRRPDDVDPVARVRQNLTLDAWTHRTEVWLDTDIETARGRLPDTFGMLQPCPEGGVLLVSGVNDLTGMAQALSGLPWRFEIRAPTALTVPPLRTARSGALRGALCRPCRSSRSRGVMPTTSRKTGSWLATIAQRDPVAVHHADDVRHAARHHAG